MICNLSFCLFLKVTSFVGLLPVLAACHISFVVYLYNCTIGK